MISLKKQYRSSMESGKQDSNRSFERLSEQFIQFSCDIAAGGATHLFAASKGLLNAQMDPIMSSAFSFSKKERTDKAFYSRHVLLQRQRRSSVVGNK